MNRVITLTLSLLVSSASSTLMCMQEKNPQSPSHFLPLQTCGFPGHASSDSSDNSSSFSDSEDEEENGVKPHPSSKAIPIAAAQIVDPETGFVESPNGMRLSQEEQDRWNDWQQSKKSSWERRKKANAKKHKETRPQKNKRE